MWLRREKSLLTILPIITLIYITFFTHGNAQAPTVRFVDKEGNILTEVVYTLHKESIYIPAEELEDIFKEDASTLYNRPRKQLKIKIKGKELDFSIGKTTVKNTADNQTFTLSKPPLAINTHPMLPIEFFTEILPSIDDIEVLYNPDLQRIRFMPKTAWISDPEETDQEWIIVIDPGHGGEDDVGCKAQNGLLEKDVVLRVAQEIQKLSKQYGYKIHLTRSEDIKRTRVQRVQSSNQLRGELFLSLHCNASFSQKHKGMHIYVNNPSGQLQFRTAAMPAFAKKRLNIRTQSNFLIKSKEFAGILQKEMNFIAANPIPISEFPIIALSEVYMPAILLELGYLTNIDDATLLSNQDHITELATAITRALKTYTLKHHNTSDTTGLNQEE